MNTKIKRRKTNIPRAFIIGLLGANMMTSYYNLQLKETNDDLNQEVSMLTSEHFYFKKKLLAEGVVMTDGHATDSRNGEMK